MARKNTPNNKKPGKDKGKPVNVTSQPTPAFARVALPTNRRLLTELVSMLTGPPSSRLGRIARLPVVRELHLRETNRFKLQDASGDRPSYQASAAGQIRGVEKAGAAACVNCVRGNGHYKACVTVNNEFNGACCNCSYDSHMDKCSFYVKPDKSAKKSSKEVEDSSSDDETGDPPDECGSAGKKFDDFDPGSGTGGAQEILA